MNDTDNKQKVKHEMEREIRTDGGIDSQTADSRTTDTGESGTNADNEVLAELRELKDKIADDDTEETEDRRPEWVFEQYVRKHREDGKAQSSIQPTRSAWNQFCDWMDEQGYIYLSDLTSNFVGRHDDWVIANTDKGKLSRGMHLSRIKSVVKHADSRGWISPNVVPDDETWEEVKPDLSDDDKVRSDPLRPERGEQITKWVRANHFGERPHVLWLLLFRYGLRVSAIRALDRSHLILTRPDDYPESDQFRPHLRFRDRPELGDEDDEGLPLKNRREELAKRRVALRPGHVEVFRQYIENGSQTGAIESRKEHAEPDKYGLYGLLTGEQNARLSDRTIRSRTHWLTCPSTYDDKCQCDGCQEFRSEHGREPYPSKVEKHCNETRSPHQVRHGAITSLLDDHNHSTVAGVVGTSPDTLRDVYDRADEYRRMNRIADDWLSD